jgi:multiple sugar transport system permease protein/putative aldouronate transport system permease protein
MNTNRAAMRIRHGGMNRLSRGDRVFHSLAVLIVSLLTIIVLLPMINVLSASFSAASAVNAGKVVLFPVNATLLNYKTILDYKSVWLGYRNTLFYTIAGTLINVALTMVCAYPLAQKSFSGRKFLSMLFFIPMIFSGGMIPNYILMRDLKITNTLWAGLLPGAISIYNMIVTRTFIQTSIPETLAEAARIDGCSPTRYFFSFVLPLSKTIIAVISMYYAVSHWNDYFNAFLYINKRELYPLQLFLREILVNSQFDSSVMSDPEAAKQLQGLADTLKYVVIVVATLPLMCVYPFVQKYFVKGVMIGSVKG